jgi:hypothetical protein
MRFYRPVIKQPISTFVEAPLDFIQGQMENEQKAIDLGREKALKANEEYLGLRAGMKSQEYLNQFKNQYDSQFNTLTQKMMQDPSQVNTIADQISMLSSNMKQNPLYNAIRDDFEKSQEFAKKAVGSDKPYYMNNPNQLAMSPDGQYQMSTAQDYGVITDKDLYSKMFDDVSKFKPDVGVDEKGNKIYSFPNGDGTFTTGRTESELTTVKLSRIEKYLDNMYNTANNDGSMEYNYRHAAEIAGDPNKAKDPAFRKQVFDEYAKPIKQQAYEQIKTTTTIDDGGKSRAANSKGGSGGVNTPTPDAIIFNPVTTQARMANYNVAGTSRPISNMSDFDLSYKNIKRDRGNQAVAMQKLYKKITGIDLPATPEAFSNIFYKQFTLNEDGKITPKVNTPENVKLASDEEFEKAFLNLKDLNATEQNIKAFENRVKEAAGVDKYDNKVLDNAKNKAVDELIATDPSIKKADLKILKQMNPDLSDLQIEEMWKNQKTAALDQKLLNGKILGNLPKDSKEQKIQSILNSYNDRMEDVELRMLPSSNKYVLDMSKTMLANIVDDKASKFKDLVSNEEINGAKLLEKIPYKVGANNEGELDFDKVQFGYFVDPNEGIKGVMMIQGQGKYEYPVNEGGLQQIIMTLSPEEQTRFSFYNQAVKSSQKNYGKGKINLGTNEAPIDFTFEESPSKVDGTKKSYVYMDEAGITRRANSIQEMQNNISRVYEGVAAAGMDPVIQTKINYIKQKTLSGEYKPDEGERLIRKTLEEARVAAQAKMGSLGKSQGWSQSPKQPLP